VITIKGSVTNATAGAPVSGPMTAHLYLYNSATSKIDNSLATEVDQAGRYQFDNVPADAKVTYFVMVSFAGVTYASDPVSYDGKFTSRDVPITVYDATEDLDQLSISQVHMQFDFSTSGQAQARFLYILSNLGKKSVLVQSDGRHIPFIDFPAGANGTQFELAQGGAALAQADNGFALLPGADKQYGIIATFSLPFEKTLTLSQPFNLPVSSATVLVPVGIRVKSDQLTDTGVQSMEGKDYHLYQGGSLASGSTLELTISGKPGSANPFSTNPQTTILVTLLVAGVLLMGLGFFLLRRGRSKEALAEVSSGAAQSDPLEDRDSIMDAIIALDDQYKGGCISRDVYHKRRDELKQKLKERL
jgi:hypothetical protein